MSTVSICIPTYNGARYLKICLDSTLAQTYADIEIICVDDCSSDSTGEILDSYSRKDSRIRVAFNSRNLGLVGNWNQCLNLARGDWIKFVFQDDFLHPQCIEKMIDASDGFSLVACMREFVFECVSDEVRATYDEIGRESSLRRLFGGHSHGSRDELAKVALDRFPKNFIGEPTAVMFRKDVIARFGAFNPAFVQLCDYEYWLRVGLNTGLAIVPEVLAGFRVHGGSTTQSNSSAGKQFRAYELENLLLLHEMIFNPLFDSVRQYAASCNPRRNLRHELARKAIWCEDYAERRAAEGDPEPLKHWNDIVSTRSALRNSASHRVVRARQWLDRHLLWRFQKTERDDA